MCLRPRTSKQPLRPRREGVLHALAILSAPASTSLQTTIMEGGARGCESITMLQVMTWAIRGISMRRAYLRGRVPLGKMSQHALFDMSEFSCVAAPLRGCAPCAVRIGCCGMPYSTPLSSA